MTVATEKMATLTIRGETAVISNGREPDEVPLTRLPASFMNWQLQSRGVLFSQHMAHGDGVTSFSAHLPVAVTRRSGGPFPFHTANKGTGLLPEERFLSEDTQALRQLVTKSAGRPSRDSLKERVAFMASLYGSPEHWERRFLGSLEIFLGQTHANILADPRITLHYTGRGPDYPSFQVNAVAQVLKPGDPHFEYLYWARQLFERDAFHIQQPAYPLGYLFWVSEVYDKSPSGHAGAKLA